MNSPNWNLSFKLICDVFDYTIGAVLSQTVDKQPRVIYYASMNLNDAQLNYSLTEKEFLIIIFALEKFRSHLIGSHVIVYANHIELRHLLTKKWC